MTAPSPSPGPSPAPRGPITVGAALSLSGRFAVQGEQARRGLTLWAEDVNAAVAAGCASNAVPSSRT